jgi:hypothetical protein
MGRKPKAKAEVVEAKDVEVEVPASSLLIDSPEIEPASSVPSVEEIPFKFSFGRAFIVCK